MLGACPAGCGRPPTLGGRIWFRQYRRVEDVVLTLVSRMKAWEEDPEIQQLLGHLALGGERFAAVLHQNIHGGDIELDKPEFLDWLGAAVPARGFLTVSEHMHCALNEIDPVEFVKQETAIYVQRLSTG